MSRPTAYPPPPALAQLLERIHLEASTPQLLADFPKNSRGQIWAALKKARQEGYVTSKRIGNMTYWSRVL